MARRAVLQAQLAASEAELRALRRTEQIARQTVYRARVQAVEVLSCHVRLAATLLHVSGAGAALVSEFLEQQYQRADGRAHSRDDVEPMIEHGSVYASCFIEAAEAVLASPGNERSLFLAGRFLAEHRTFQWLVETNSRGVAPNTQRLCMQFHSSWPRNMMTLHSRWFLHRLLYSRLTRRRWATLFRRKWCVRWRRLSARADLEAEEIRKRARSPVFFFTRGPEMGPKYGDHFGVHIWGSVLLYLHKMGPKSGYQKKPPNLGTAFVPFLFCEVSTFMLWGQWLHNRVFSGQPVVTVNLDESPLERQIAGRHGNVLSLPSESASRRHLVERIPRHDTHSHTTLVACVCDDPVLQTVLPQFFLPKDSILRVAEKERFRAMSPPLTYVEGSSGWVTSANFCGILTTLRRVILHYRPGASVLVVMDAASQHLSADVLNHCARLRLSILPVPGRLTYLLQPLDSHVFATLKRELQLAQAEQRLRSTSGRLPPTAWITIMETVVRRVLCERTWVTSLRENGVLGDMSAVRPALAVHLAGSLPLPLRPPTPEEVLQMIGRNRRDLPGRLLRGPLAMAGAIALEDRAEPEAPHSVGAPPAAPPAPPALPPIAYRTRSRSALVE